MRNEISQREAPKPRGSDQPAIRQHRRFELRHKRPESHAMSRDFAIAVFAVLALVLIVAPLFMLLRLLTQFGFGMSGIFGIAG